MNDDDLLFPLDDVQLWRNGDLPDPWLEDRKNVLIARCRSQAAVLQRLMAQADAAQLRRLDKNI